MPRFTTGYGSFTVGTTTPVTTTVKCSSIDFPENEEITGDESGTLYEETLSLTKLAPVPTITTGAIEQILKLVALNGSCIGPTEGTYPIQNLAIVYRHEGDCDTPVGVTNYQAAIAKGLARLGTLTANRNADASITVIAHALSDGTNEPVAITDGVALPAGVTERFRLGVCSIGGFKFDDLDGVSLEFGSVPTEDDAEPGKIFVEKIGVRQVQPQWVFRGRNLSRVKDAVVKLVGIGATHVNTTIQLRKLKDQASYEEPTANEHILITTHGLLVPSNLGSASTGARATNELRLPASFDGTNAPVKWTLDQQYNPDIGT